MRTSRKLNQHVAAHTPVRDTAFGAGGPVAELHDSIALRLNGQFDYAPYEQGSVEAVLSTLSRGAGWLSLAAGYGVALYLILG